MTQVVGAYLPESRFCRQPSHPHAQQVVADRTEVVLHGARWCATASRAPLSASLEPWRSRRGFACYRPVYCASRSTSRISFS